MTTTSFAAGWSEPGSEPVNWYIADNLPLVLSQAFQERPLIHDPSDPTPLQTLHVRITEVSTFTVDQDA